ncbi:hypothetical protein [Flavobacterium fluviale]|uniref:DUF262 domain-containing protein n=1 Tax=Flavobacterium fluviale TaxID=2249356 RepID=A0A344LTR9_9FLAO|nr:hypothetical protein [Flavobacterium fluviale]AXB57311.1 hypothetical protein HYN86_12185 [Flavobacterium fluviale]
MAEIIAQVLDSRTDDGSRCFLSKFTLYEYLNNLPNNYREYDIQREVVSSNVYLDKIIETVLNKYHIPSIVIVLQNYKEDGKSIIFNSNDYKIIDGLQRTHRLKIIFDTYILLKEKLNLNNEIISLSKFQLSKKYSKELSLIKSNFKILSKLIDYYIDNDSNIKKLESIFIDNFIWFELWTNLDSKKQVEKMLLLNAGHKPVKLKHQLELLFINDLLEEFKHKDKFNEFILIREKDMNSTSFSKNREYGQFHFSQIIAALIAFDTGKTLVTNTNLISKIQDNDYSIQDLSNELTYNFINDIIEFLLDFDRILVNHYKSEIKWFGREASLVGLFAALGRYRIDNEIENPKEIFSNVINFLEKNPYILNLNDYDNGRKILDLSKINFGSVNRKVVFRVFTDILKSIDKPALFPNEPIDWVLYFTNVAIN